MMAMWINIVEVTDNYDLLISYDNIVIKMATI